MNEETYEALKRVIEKTRNLLSQKYANRKRLKDNEVWEKATTIRDIVAIEGWIDEVAKEYEPIKEDVYSVIANNKLYYKKTDGGAEYLCKRAIEGTEVGDIKTAVVRLDSGAELL